MTNAMKCQRCHFENGDDAFFCMKCGQKLYTAVLQRKDAVGLEDTYYLLPITYSIGRDPGNQIVLSDSKVSRRHARLFIKAGAFYLADLGSKNGVIVNEDIINRVKLSNGDIIQIGQDKFVFKNEIELRKAELEVDDVTLGPILKVLSQINQTFHQSHSLEEILNIILDCVMEITRFQHGFLFVYDKNGMTKLEFTRNMRDPNIDDLTSTYSATAVDQAKHSGEIVFARNTSNSADFMDQKSIINLRLMSLICIPIVSIQKNPDSEFGVKVGERTILGVIYVDNEHPTDIFSERRMEILKTLANQAAIAVEKKLMQRVSLEKNEIDRDLDLAQKIQQNLLPREVPELARLDIAGINEPCKQIGGDYYDFLKLKDGKLCLLIADVCGKGVPAALLMSSLQATLKSQIQYISDLGEIVTNLNQSMMENAPSNRFITMFIGIYNPDECSFQYINCGHNPALLLRATGQFEEFKSSALPIGIRHPINLQLKSVVLEPNDVMLLYTDGVTEVRNAQDAQFGMENLRQALAQTVADQPSDALTCEDVIDGVLEHIYEFSGQGEKWDDMTLVAIKPLNPGT